MNCNVVKDLIPLYIDGCCSEESEAVVKSHIQTCDDCRKLYEDMKAPSDVVSVSEAPIKMRKINDWKASVMQSLLLFLSFAAITIGVALEARTPDGPMNGFWAVNLIIPATGFMLSLANWYFVSVYKSRRSFSNCASFATLGITLCAYVWAIFHYQAGAPAMQNILHFGGIGIILTVVLCVLSKVLSNLYGKMLGKE